MTIGARLKKIRENLGLSQASMATVAKCHKKSWEGYEADNNLPGGEVLSNLAKAGVDINWILTGQANQTENTINIYDVEFSAGCGSTLVRKILFHLWLFQMISLKYIIFLENLQRGSKSAVILCNRNYLKKILLS